MPDRNIPVSALNQAIYDRLQELGYISGDGTLRATAASKAIFGEDRRQLVEGWVKAGRDPKLDAETQQTLCHFLEVSPRRVLELAGFDTGDDYGESAMRPYLTSGASHASGTVNSIDPVAA